MPGCLSRGVGDPIDIHAAVEAGLVDQHVVPVPGETTAGRGRNGHRGPPVDHRIRGVTESQLDTGAEGVTHGGPQIRPAGGRQDHVDAVGQTVRGQSQDDRLEVLELGAERLPPVDHQKDVGVLGDGSTVLLGQAATGLVDRGDLVVPECGLPASAFTVHLGDGAADLLVLSASCHPADVR